jgi:transcription antitermination factor NusG
VTRFSGAMSNLQPTRLSEAPPARTVDSEGLYWFAVQTWPRYEKKVGERLEQKGATVFIPLFTEQHQWSDRRNLIHTPVFPHYVFVRIAKNARVPILRTDGVVHFVGGRGTGIPIPDSEIESIRAVLLNGLPFCPHPFLEIGRRVRIRGGSLDGIEGILVEKHEDLSLLVSVQIIQRSLAIRVRGYQIEPL